MTPSSSAPVTGAAPPGAADPRAASQAVREMFTAIAPRYDLLNHVLSCNVDRIWWARAARAFAGILQNPAAQVLDLCCGTGDMAFALAARRPSGGAAVRGVDFSHAMLLRARRKSADRRMNWIEADALNLPFPDASFDLVTSAFGFRNLADYDAGLREIARVLRPGGEVGLLDFGMPGGAAGHLYRLYFRRVLPLLGTLVSGVRGPYRYLPASVQRFPATPEMLERMRHAGFMEPSWTPYTLGIAGLFRAKRSPMNTTI